jgi:eukaryotic-like serine/threonine-protein kinase
MQAEHSVRLPFAGDFRVGDWLVEPSLDRATRNGTVVRLRPQLTDLLVLLARHAGRTVSKEAILSEVWAGQFVAESGMTRCIAEIRQALEDDAHVPRVIETIPKRGYRLVAPVEFLPPPAEDGPAHQALQAEPPAPPRVASSPAPRPRGPGWTAASTVGVVLALALTWGATGKEGSPVISDRDTVVLADVVNTTGDATFDDTLRLALAVQLGQAPFLNILPAEHVRAALSLMGRTGADRVTGPVALEVCRREAAALLLAGSIARLGSHYAVGIEAIACVTGEPVGRELVEVETREQVLTALGKAAGRLRRTLGESRASLQAYAVPIVQATTPSLDALKALSVGDFHRDHARLGDALTFYRRATDLDSQFAVAWARRGAAAKNLGLDDESTAAFRTAYDLRERVSEPERFYILGHYYRSVAGDFDQAVETYKMWQRIYPGSAVPPTNLASTYLNTFGRYDAALPEALEAVRLAPYSSVANTALVRAYLGLNRVADARKALRVAASRGVGDLLWRVEAYHVAYLDGDAVAMREQSAAVAGDPHAEVVMAAHRALAAAASGRLIEAGREWALAERTAALAGPTRVAEVRLSRARAEALLGDPRAARAAVEAALAVSRRADKVLQAAITMALASDPTRARVLIDEAVRTGHGDACATRVWLPVARALVEAQLGRHDRALELLREVAPFERGRDFGLAPLGARAVIELSAGRSKEAAAAFKELLDLRTVLPTSPWVAFARLGLARALRDAGDAAGSRAAYGVVLDGTMQADADAPTAAAARRERAALDGQ